MDSPERQWHYVSPNEQTRIPRRHIVMDAGARSTRTKWGHEWTWRTGHAWFARNAKGRKLNHHEQSYANPEELWEDITAFCVSNGRTVLWAHNVGWQLRIAQAFTILPRLGWELVAHNLIPHGSWLIWRNESKSLTIVDVASVWPKLVPEIGKMFGMAKPAIPTDSDDLETWDVHCRQTVRILATAVINYLGWIEREDMGNWQLTGAGQSWSAYRHKWMRHRLLVHADQEASAAERRAMWTGRCEAFWRGTMLRQVVHEWDLHVAYARIARDHNVPTRLIAPMPPRHNWREVLDNPRVALLAQVTVDTEVPSVPSEVDGRIIWPVGRFDTTLWDVEIRQAIDDGATVTVNQGWLYHAEPALHDWAVWCIWALSAPDEVIPAWIKAIVKHWVRALVGRFAMQYSNWDQWATSEVMGAERFTLIDEVDNETVDVMHIGAQLWRESGVQDWGQSMAAITGYVMSALRVRLWRLVQQLPREAVLYVDTDSILATDRWYDAISRLARTPSGDGLRLKTSWDGFSIYGPRQLVTGKRVRMAGVPLRASRTQRHEFQGEVFESVDVALRAGRTGMVRAVDRTWHTSGRDRRRGGPPIGFTTPIRVGGGAE